MAKAMILWTQTAYLYTAGFTPKKRNELLSAKAVDEICALVETGEEVHAWLVGAAMQELLIRTADSDAIVRVLGNDPFANMQHDHDFRYALYAYNLNVMESVGTTDDIDMLGNRRSAQWGNYPKSV